MTAPLLFEFIEVPTVDAVGDALLRLAGTGCGVLALVAEADREIVPVLQRACERQNLELAGAVFPELVVDDRFYKRGVLLLPLPMDVRVTLATDLSHAEDTESALGCVAEMAEAHSGADGASALFLIFDCLVPNIATLLDGLYLSLADRVRYMGVNAGSETFQPIDCLFDRQHFVRDALLALLLPAHGGAALAHGYHSPDQVITATATSGNRITSIDWRPAFEVYARLIQDVYGARVTPANFYQHAVHYPLGILRMDGEVVVRIPVALDESGAVTCVGEIPENAVLTLLKAASADAGDTVRLLGEHCDRNPVSLVQTFYCAGRRMHLGDDARRELGELSRRLRPARLAGALSLGEIGSAVRGGYPLFHNATVVCIPWGGP
ncbi:MAG: FIST C-terminal domain-containing protein [Nitrospirota bacterium]|nr:FIST C-terminal domain-containing protein [Nitrospirota bacterium]